MISIIFIRNQKVKSPVETIFSREIVDVYRGLQNIRVIRRYNWQRDRALSIIAANLAAYLAKITLRSQLSTANKAFVECAEHQ